VFTHIQQVQQRARSGGNELANLVELCWFHHRLVHEAGWSVRLEANGDVLAIRPNGNVLARPRSTEVRERHGLECGNREHGTTIDPTTCLPRLYGDRFDLDEIVSSLVATEPSA
jgi:hypothetical protein